MTDTAAVPAPGNEHPAFDPRSHNGSPHMNAVAPILMEPDLQSPRERFERFVRWTVDHELPRCSAFLSEPERALFVRDGLLVPPARGADRDRHIRALWRGPAG